MTELKPCPFCGGEAYIAHRRDERFWNYYCGCVDCGVETLGHDRKKEAIEAWNHRPSPWHTGEPTRTDCLYLVLWYNTEEKAYQHSVLNWHDRLHCWYDEETPYCLWGDEDRAEVVAWMPFKPYKGDDT